MKKNYITPQLEVYLYLPEKGFAVTVALEKDYILIEGHDGTTLRTNEEVTEYTDDEGEYYTGEWE